MTSVGAKLDPTFATLAQHSTLEDNPFAPDPFYPPYAAEELAPHALTPTNERAAQLLALSTDPLAYAHNLFDLPRLADLRRNIAVVSQDPVLFNDTIYHNLLIARPEASRSEIESAPPPGG